MFLCREIENFAGVKIQRILTVFEGFVLEHLKDPIAALESLKRVLKNDGSITVIEGDHGSCYFHPETKEAIKAWKCLIECQKRLNCNPMIGREVYPLLTNSGFKISRFHQK